MIANPRTVVALGASLTMLLILPIVLPDGFFVLPKLAVTALWLAGLSVVFFLNWRKYQYALPQPMSSLLVIYLIWSAISNLFLSPYREFTLIGWPNWYSAFILTLLIAAVFALANVVRRDAATPISPALHVLFVLSALMCGLSVLERLGFNPIIGGPWFVIPDLPKDFAPILPIATVGNPGWLAGLWLLMLPLPFINEISRRLAVPWLLINAMGLATTSNKTSLYVGVAALGVYLAWNQIKKRNSNHVTLLIAITLMLATSPLLTLTNQFLVASGIVSRSVQAAAVDASAGSSSLYNRVLIWKSALRLTAQRPLTGWGLDTLQMNFFTGMPKDEYQKIIAPVVKLKSDETVQNTGFLHMVFGPNKTFRRMQFFTMVKPHNALIEEIYSHGVIGFTLLIALLLSCLRFVLRYGGRTEHLLLAACGLYGIYLLLWFTTIAVTPTAATLLGFAIAGSARRRQPVELPVQPEGSDSGTSAFDSQSGRLDIH